MQKQTSRTTWRADSLIITTRHPFTHPETGQEKTHGLIVDYLGVFDDVATALLQQQWQEDKRFKPEMPAQEVHTLRGNWQRAVNASIAWANEKVPV
mgnify:CR=1 FL=1